jgi:hypothetical protein
MLIIYKRVLAANTSFTPVFQVKTGIASHSTSVYPDHLQDKMLCYNTLLFLVKTPCLVCFSGQETVFVSPEPFTQQCLLQYFNGCGRGSFCISLSILLIHNDSACYNTHLHLICIPMFYKSMLYNTPVFMVYTVFASRLYTDVLQDNACSCYNASVFLV